MNPPDPKTQTNPAGNLRVIETGRTRVASDARNELVKLIERIDAGEVYAVFGVIENTGGTYEPFGSSTMSRLQTSGALLDAAMARLGYRITD